MGVTVGIPDLFGVVSVVTDVAAKVIRFPSEVLQSVTDDSERFTPEVAAAAGLGQTERDETWRERDALTAQVSSLEYSEHAIVDDDPFDAMSHAEIFDHVQRMKPETLNAIGEAWQVIAQRTDTGINQFQQAISAAIGEGWQGQGGSAALGAVLAYSDNGNQLKTRVKLISNKVDEARIALDEVKRSIPEPDGASTFESLISLIPGATRNQAQHEAEEAERRARQVMKDVYLPNMRRADDQVPVLPAAFNPITGDGGGSGSTGGGSGTGTSGGSASGGGLNPYSFSDGNAGGSGDSGAAAGVPGQDVSRQGTADGTLADGGTTAGGSGFGDASQGDANGSGAGGVDGSGGAGTLYPDGAAETTAASAAPSALAGANPAGGTSGVPQTSAFGAGAASPSSGVGAGSGTPGGSGWGPRGGAFGSGGSGGAFGSGGSGGAFGSGGSGGALGSAGRGALAGGSGALAGGSGGGNNAARTPMMGGMGGMAGGRGQGQGEDDTHQTPGFLINVDNGNTLIGELPMVTPAVLGE